MNCPRCGSHKTSQSDRKPDAGVVITDQNCDQCGWHGAVQRPAEVADPTPARPKKKVQGRLF